MLFYILLTVQILICISLAGLILIQRSEGGALGMGGGPSGFMSARGAGNLLTRLTAIFGVLFFANSIGLTIVGNLTSRPASAIDQVDTSKLPANTNILAPSSVQAPAAATTSSAAPSLNDLPLAGASAPATSSPAARPATAPAASLGPSINLSMPSQTATSKLDLPKAEASASKAAPKPAKAASSSSSTASVRSASAAPSSSASTTPSAATTSPASSQ